MQNGDRTYGASHVRDHMMDPNRTAMLAFMQNGELLHPDHGYPVTESARAHSYYSSWQVQETC